MRREFKSWLLFLPVAIVLAGLGVFMATRRQPIIEPLRQHFSSLPTEIGEWRGQDVLIGRVALDVLGNGDFLFRSYKRMRGEPQVELFAAYFPQQTSGNSIHSPKNCLPGSGWVPVESTRIRLAGPKGTQFWANQYIVQKAMDRALVLYWYQAHDRLNASEYWAKYYLVKDSITMRRSDGGLIRITTPLLEHESVETAQVRAKAFASQVIPLLDDFIPR